jgi:isopentenyl-diphosphate delta-isomerase
MENVILVNEHDNEIGIMEKMEAHRSGLLHRAFSILLFNNEGEILLQKRSLKKYHSGGLWTNTCCSHPLPGEAMEHATIRKLKQEMGIDVRTEFAYKFIYKAVLEKGLTEHECDYVFTGIYNGTPIINEEEVEDWKYMNIISLRKDMLQNPHNYTSWFQLIVNHPQSVNIIGHIS